MTSHLTPQQEMDAALAIVRIGLERIRDAATRTEDAGPHAAALRTLYDAAAPQAGVLGAVSDVIGTIAVSVSEVDDDRIEEVKERLDEACAAVEDTTGEHLYRALVLLDELTPAPSTDS